MDNLNYITAREFILLANSAINAVERAERSINELKLTDHCDFESIWSDILDIQLCEESFANQRICKSILQSLFESTCAHFHELHTSTSDYDDVINEPIDFEPY